MKCLYLLVTLLLGVVMAASHRNQTECRGMIFHNRYYVRRTLFGSMNQPSHLTTHKYTKELFFTHLDWNNTAEFRIKVCNISNNICKDIKEVTNGVAVAYDPIYHDVFFGNKDGIYKYNRSSSSAFLVTKYANVSQVFIQNNVFVISHKRLYVLNDGAFKFVPEVKGIEVENFFVSEDYSIYLTNSTGLYKANTTVSPVYLLSNTVKVRQITQDYRHGGVYFAAIDGIYKDDAGKLIKVANANNVYGITFKYRIGSKYDESRLIYSDHHKINILWPTKRNEFCLDKLNRQLNELKGNLNETHLKPRL